MKKTQEELRAYMEAALQAAKNSGKVHSQAEFAELTATNPSLLSQYLSGKLPPSPSTLRRIATELAKYGIIVENLTEGDTIHQTAGDNATQIGKQYSSGDISALITEMAEQRKMYGEQIARMQEQMTGMIKQNTQLITIITESRK